MSHPCTLMTIWAKWRYSPKLFWKIGLTSMKQIDTGYKNVMSLALAATHISNYYYTLKAVAQLILCSNGFEISSDSITVQLIIFYKGWNPLLTAFFSHNGKKINNFGFLYSFTTCTRSACTRSNVWSYYKLISELPHLTILDSSGTDLKLGIEFIIGWKGLIGRIHIIMTGKLHNLF